MLENNAFIDDRPYRFETGETIYTFCGDAEWKTESNSSQLDVGWVRCRCFVRVADLTWPSNQNGNFPVEPHSDRDSNRHLVHHAGTQEKSHIPLE